MATALGARGWDRWRARGLDPPRRRRASATAGCRRCRRIASPASCSGWLRATPPVSAAAEWTGQCRDADVRDVVRGLARPRLAGAGGAGRAVGSPLARVPVAWPGAVDRGRAAPPRRAPWHEAATRSYGNGALCRAAAVGDRPRPGDLQSIGEAASVDAAVTHASRRATASSAALAGIVAGLVRREPATSSRRRRRAASSARLPRRRPGEPPARPRLAGRARRRGRRAGSATGRTPRRRSPWPCGARSRRPTRPRRSPLRRRLQRPRRHRRRRHRRARRGDPRRFGAAGGMGRRARGGGALSACSSSASSTPHRPAADRADRLAPAIWFLLDRSGSMQSIADDVVVGFDRFFAEQRAAGRRGDRHDRPVRRPRSARRPRRRPPARRRALDPRAVRAPRRDAAVRRHRAAARPRRGARRRRRPTSSSSILTDGVENASRPLGPDRVFRRVGRLRDAGWTFVFLGANQDSYDGRRRRWACTPATSATSSPTRRASTPLRRPQPHGLGVAGQGPRRPPAATATTSGAAARKPRSADGEAERGDGRSGGRGRARLGGGRCDGRAVRVRAAEPERAVRARGRRRFGGRRASGPTTRRWRSPCSPRWPPARPTPTRSAGRWCGGTRAGPSTSATRPAPCSARRSRQGVGAADAAAAYQRRQPGRGRQRCADAHRAGRPRPPRRP